MNASATAPALRTAARLGGVREYYFSRKLREIAERRAAGEDVINLGIGSPDLPPPSAALAALDADVAKAAAHGYQSYRGTAVWRGALRTWYASAFGVGLSEEEILPLAGSKEGIVHLSLALLEAGTSVMYPDPGYPAYAAAARLAQAGARPYSLPGDRDAGGWVEELDRVADREDVRVLFVNSPHMPTGQVLGDEHLAALIGFARARSILLVSDNAYGYYGPDGPRSLLAANGAREVAVELNSLSKSHHMPGWRLGVLAGRADVLAAALQVKSNLDSGQFRPVQAGAAAALAADDAWHAEQRAVISERRVVGESLLRDLGCVIAADQYGLFVWARLPGDAPDSEAFCDRLLDEAGVFLPPGTVFGAGGAGCIRLSLCSPIEILHKARERCAAIATVR